MESYEVMFLEVDIKGNIEGPGANLAALCSVGWYIVGVINDVQGGERDAVPGFSPVAILILQRKRSR